MVIVETYELYMLLLKLAGLGAFVSALVNLLKQLKVVPDGAGGSVVAIINTALFIALFIAKLLGVDFSTLDWLALDVNLEGFANLIGLLMQLLGSELAYKLMGGKLPVLGYSYSRNGGGKKKK
jgi:hypothetical protein